MLLLGSLLCNVHDVFHLDNRAVSTSVILLEKSLSALETFSLPILSVGLVPEDPSTIVLQPVFQNENLLTSDELDPFESLSSEDESDEASESVSQSGSFFSGSFSMIQRS